MLSLHPYIVNEKTLCSPQNVMPPVISDNPAYDSVNNLKLKDTCTNPVKHSVQDYENIGEVYFKGKDITEGVYESAVVIDPPSVKSASVYQTTQLTVLM